MSQAAKAGHGLPRMVLGAIGIVFGDIGTSPLYALAECLNGPHGVAPTEDNVLGVVSLLVWAITLVVTIKYLVFIMRADNHGEGGIFALLALVPPSPTTNAKGGACIAPVAIAVLVGAALLFGDGMITPAISVLSAVEGLEVAAPAFAPAVVPVTVVVLALLFLLQPRGTTKIGALFGPVMSIWFLTMAGLGVMHVVREPRILEALSPWYAARFFTQHGIEGATVLGSVVLAVTGGEALYADMGHLGAKPIRIGWLTLAYPSLLACYLGQGALVLHDPSMASTPFFGMVPHGPLTYVLVAIATPATVIASQALISGVFSLTHQAIRLGYFPRMEIRHPGDAEGQVYVPAMNWALAIACTLLVVTFRASARLAGAYGLAVSGTMLITSVVFYVVATKTWKWSRWRAIPLLVLFLAIDVPFVLANLLKFRDGGYLPVLVGLVFFVVMANWRVGRIYLAQHFAAQTPPLDEFLRDVAVPRQSAEPGRHIAARVPGCGVFLSVSPDGVPPFVDRMVQRLHVLPEQVVFMTVLTENVPVVAASERITTKDLGQGFHRVIAHAGFKESPSLPEYLREAIERDVLPITLDDVTYYLGRETFVAGAGGRMHRISEELFSFLSRNAHRAPMYFRVPPERIVEIGAQIDL